MEIGEENLDSATGSEEIGDLGHRHEVGDVRPAGGRRSPVNTQVTLRQNGLTEFRLLND